MDTAAAKRKRSDEPDAVEEDGGDSVIGLDVGGQLFYTHKSTLTAGSTYFAARFGGSFSAGVCRKDDNGRNVYFVDADGKLFEHILAFLRRAVPSWPDEPVLVERLVAEAEYFGMENMRDKLLGRASFAPNSDQKGILYWLGTKRGKATSIYENPYKRGEILVQVRGKTHPYDEDLSDFFQYRPSCKLTGSFELLSNDCCFLDCGDPGTKESDINIIEFRSILVKPSHYSLRYGACYGMSDWNFEASIDKATWNVIHAARKDRHILNISKKDLRNLPDEKDNRLAIVEEKYRHTWEVNTTSYYKYFRFTFDSKSGDYYKETYGREYNYDSDNEEMIYGDDGRVLFSNCLHGVGFELFGDVMSAE